MKRARIVISAILSFGLSACSVPESDEPLTVCQRLVYGLMNEGPDSIEWVSNEKRKQRVGLRFIKTDSQGTLGMVAICTFAPNQGEGKYPIQITVNGEKIIDKELQTAIFNVTGEEIPDIVTPEEQAAEEIQQGVEKAMQNVVDPTKPSEPQSPE